MAKEKINADNKRSIAKGNFKGKQFDVIAGLTGTCPSTVRKADREGKLLNEIDNLEFENRQKDVQIAVLKGNLNVAQKRKYNN